MLEVLQLDFLGKPQLIHDGTSLVFYSQSSGGWHWRKTIFDTRSEPLESFELAMTAYLTSRDS